MTTTPCDVLFSDDTVNDVEHSQIIQRLGYEVIRVRKTLDAKEKGETVPIVQALANARNCLREEFVKRKEYTKAMWIDSDIIPPVYAINQLLSHNKDIVSGVYWQFWNKTPENPNTAYLAPMVFGYEESESKGLGVHEYMTELTVQHLFPNRLIGGQDTPIVGIGTGCFMASRKLMEDERWTFRFNPDKIRTTEDMWFSLDINSLGYEIYVDTTVCCRHYMQPWASYER